MNLGEFKQWARRKLGESACGVRVELSDEQLEQALADAKDWFHAYMGIYKEAQITLVEGTSEYSVASVSPLVDSVVKVFFTSQTQSIDFSTLYPGFLDINGFPYGLAPVYGGNYPQTTIVQMLQTIESTARILSTELDWEFYKDVTTTPVTRIIRVMPAPTTGGLAYYLYKVDPSAIKLEWYEPRALFMLREWAFAEAKYILGRIRGKYTGGLPAAGGDRTLDGEALLSEAQADKERLQQQILDYQGPILPAVG